MDRAVTFGGGKMFGVLSEPLQPREGPCVLILNSGLIYRVGPGRLSVELARSAGGAGLACFRFDLSGLGDSEPRVPPLGPIESVVADAREAMDHLDRHFGYRRFVLVGLCSGAVHAHHIAAADARVVGAALMDGYVYSTLRSRLTEIGERLRSPGRLARGVLRRAVRLVSPGPAAPVASAEEDAFLPFWPPRAKVETDLSALRDRGVALLFVFTPEWTGYRYAGQMSDAFRRVDYGARLIEKQIDEAEHLYLERRARNELTDTVGRWLAAQPWAEPAC
jgi:pimeloyl-ACP methyl ester carboxylesterase